MNLTPRKFPAPLDPHFQPVVMFNRDYVDAVQKTGRAVPLVIGLEREQKLVSRYETVTFPEAGNDTFRYVERLVKFLLWARGGWKLYVGGHKTLGDALRRTYSVRGTRKFDYAMMTSAYGRNFEVVVTTPEKVPAARESTALAGGHLQGCRIGFDLGASDYKVSAVIDGTPVFTEETPWDPKNQPNPDYHYHHLSAGLHRAAAHLPRVDAIGGSSAGIIVDNEIRAASLLRAVPKKDFPRAAQMFKRIGREWGVPIQVMNDGDVTALAGALSLGSRSMLGLAMGSSQAAGFMDRHGGIPGYLNELAFAPVDLNPAAGADEWSKDRGTGVLYFSQQAVNRLLPAARIDLPAHQDLPTRLVQVQHLMARGDQRAAKIYETIGHYLGFAMAQYAEFYAFEEALILGRVMTGPGGDIIIDQARAVLQRHFPESSTRIKLRVPDEKSRRIGQAVAAASLPAAPKSL